MRSVIVLSLSILGLAAPSMAAISPTAETNLLLSYLNIRHDSTIDGLTQTFLAGDTRLIDAAITIASPDNAEPAWSNAFIEIRKGPPGNITGADGNVVFRSNQIDFGNLPQIGSDNGNPLYAARLSDLGLNSLLPLEKGVLYSLVLKDEGTGGRLHWVDWGPVGPYANGGTTTHVRGAGASTWTFLLVQDIGFRVAFVPEPGVAGLLLLCPLLRRRR